MVIPNKPQGLPSKYPCAFRGIVGDLCRLAATALTKFGIHSLLVPQAGAGGYPWPHFNWPHFRELIAVYLNPGAPV